MALAQDLTAGIEVPQPADVPMLIDGELCEATTGEWITVVSPRDRTAAGRAPAGDATDIDRAVRAATAALPGWRARPPAARGDLLRRIADDLDGELERIARLSAFENGNALRTQTRAETRFVVDAFRYFGGLAGEMKGETVPLGTSSLDFSLREPVGVVGAIIPWNAPMMLASLKVAPALAAGNTMVLKVAEEAPMAVLELARIWAAHLPRGVLNVVNGYGTEAGEALARHPDVTKLSFTGSTEVGRRVMHNAADRVVPVSLELGGKSPQIVFPDSSGDDVVEGVLAGMRVHRQSQSCTAGSRLFVHASIFDDIVGRVVDRLATLRVGDPLDEATDVGAIVSETQFNKVCGYIADGVEHGGTVLTGGLPTAQGPLAGGNYLEPTVLTGVGNDWRVAAEEIFGPVLCAISWQDEDEVIQMANATHYGLAGFVWCRDVARALRAAMALDAGWVQVNQGGGQKLGQSYGGTKQSGFGREFSLEGMLDSYTRRKHVSVGLST